MNFMMMGLKRKEGNSDIGAHVRSNLCYLSNSIESSYKSDI